MLEFNWLTLSPLFQESIAAALKPQNHEHQEKGMGEEWFWNRFFMYEDI